MNEYEQVQLDRAASLVAGGRASEATALYTALANSQSQNADLFYRAGIGLIGLENYEEAVAAFTNAVRLVPDDEKAWNNLGAANFSLRKLEEAEAAFRRALDLRPGYEDCISNLVGLYIFAGRRAGDSGHDRRALELFRRGLEVNPDHYRLLCMVGVAEGNFGNLDGSVECLSHAVSLEPDDEQAYMHLSDILEKAGRVDEAAEWLKEALARVGHSNGLDLIAARVLRRQGEEKEALRLLQGLDAGSGTLFTRSQIAMETGELLDRSNDREGAWEQFERGNRLVAERVAKLPWKKEDFVREVRLMREVVESADPAGFIPAIEGDETPPAFMIGFPRSGTTLLDSMLNAHPGLEVLEEQETIVAVQATLIAQRPPYPATLPGLTNAELGQARTFYRARVAELARVEPGTLVIDKLPFHTVRVPLILRLFPDARIILSLRHPCDVVLSCFMQSFGLNAAMANFLTLEDTANLYAETMSLWQLIVERFGIDFHAVRYEDLIADYRRQAEGVFGFLGLPWDDEVLGWREKAIAGGLITTPSYRQVTQPIYGHAAGRWRRYEKQLEPVMPVLKPFIDYFGYADD